MPTTMSTHLLRTISICLVSWLILPGERLAFSGDELFQASSLLRRSQFTCCMKVGTLISVLASGDNATKPVFSSQKMVSMVWFTKRLLNSVLGKTFFKTSTSCSAATVTIETFMAPIFEADPIYAPENISSTETASKGLDGLLNFVLASDL